MMSPGANLRGCVSLALLLLAAPVLAAAPSGWKFHQGQPGKPAVLLIHGLASSSRHWMNPAGAWSIKSGHFQHEFTPPSESGKGEHPKAGVLSALISPVDNHAGADGSFWAYLTAQGFTVATWDQVPCMDVGNFPTTACLDSDSFDAAWPSTKAAFEELARVTDPKMPIALVGHSRGGLLVRRLLKEKTLTGIDRVQTAITLHTPHHGSSMATHGVEVEKALKNLAGALDLSFLPKALHEAAHKVIPDATRGLSYVTEVLVKLSGLRGARELAKDGPIYQALEKDEVKQPHVKYFTFGGDSPRIARSHLMLYTPASAEPLKEMKDMGRGVKRPGTVYRWEKKAHQILDFPESLKVPALEFKQGGDLLVTNESAKFRFATSHEVNPVNHAAVLWNRHVQERVAALLLQK